MLQSMTVSNMELDTMLHREDLTSLVLVSRWEPSLLAKFPFLNRSVVGLRL